MLWVVAVATVAIALFPNFVPRLLAGESAGRSGQAETQQAFVVGIDGMSCPLCAARLEQALRELPGVASAVVDFSSGRATVRGDGRVTLERLRAAVEQAGFRLRPVEPGAK